MYCPAFQAVVRYGSFFSAGRWPCGYESVDFSSQEIFWSHSGLSFF